MNRRVVIISDDRDIQNDLAAFNQSGGWNLLYYHGKNRLWEIIEFLNEHRGDIVLIDDDYTEPDSEKIIRSIKKMGEKIKIIFLTSDPSIGLGQKISQLAIDFYGIKPIAGHDLAGTIESLNEMEVN